jgi:hypothetical protein
VFQQVFSFLSSPILKDLNATDSVELMEDHYQNDSDQDTDGPDENSAEENEEESEDDIECYSTSYVFIHSKVNQTYLSHTHTPQHEGENLFSPPEMIS